MNIDSREVLSSALIFLSAFVGSTLLTLYFRALFKRRGVVDTPNQRSSHLIPTPRGGGLAIVIVSVTGITILFIQGMIGSAVATALILGGCMVAVAGLKDDFSHVPAVIRLLVHSGAACIAVLFCGAITHVDLFSFHISLGYAAVILTILGLVWFVNLFNFMDGLDGFAASEALFVFFAVMMFAYAGKSAELVNSSLILAACVLGFLVFNWPRASIFMGDVGSSFLGFCIALFIVVGDNRGFISIWTSLILTSPFWIDATITLARRLLRRERVYEAHRSHAYQHLQRRFSSHLSVCLVLWMINLFWVLPISILSWRFSGMAPIYTLICVIPITVGTIIIGASRN
jgi:Fuc2NAc and GlcNAc transferase